MIDQSDIHHFFCWLQVVETVFEVRSFSGNLTWVEVANVKDTVWTGESIAQGRGLNGFENQQCML